MNRKEFYHKLNRVYWHEETKEENLTIKEMDALKTRLKASGSLCKAKWRRDEWLVENSYRIDCKGYYEHLYANINGELKHYVAHTFDDSKNVYRQSGQPIKSVGARAASLESRLFQEKNGCTPRKAFGYCERKLIHNCIPKQFYYINENYLNRNIKNVSKVDFSSHYPANQCGRMPLWTSQKLVKGTVEPTDEYPFAFYINSGNVAEKGVFDTHNWEKHRLFDRLINTATHKIIAPEDDVTILCKASNYSYDSVINELYNKKLNNQDIYGVPAKLILNSAIGYKHLSDLNSTRCRLDHIAAIVIARANQKMLDIVDTLRHAVLHVCVDGMIYIGNEIGTKTKGLGNLMQELSQCDFRMRGTNQYMFFKDGKFIEEKHGGFDQNIVTTCLEDINKWQK